LKNLILRCFEKFGLYLTRHPIERYTSELIQIVEGNLIAQCNGVLHIGAHIGQEAARYHELGKNVIFIEANPNIFRELEINIKVFAPKQRAFNYLLGDADKNVQFNIANNDGQSSSLLKFSPNSPLPRLQTADVISLPMRRLDSIFDLTDLKDYDFWVVDVQGAEMLFLEGTGELLNLCKYLFIEVSTELIYSGGILWGELLDYLSHRGFKYLMPPGSAKHLNILFVRN